MPQEKFSKSDWFASPSKTIFSFSTQSTDHTEHTVDGSFIWSGNWTFSEAQHRNGQLCLHFAGRLQVYSPLFSRMTCSQSSSRQCKVVRRKVQMKHFRCFVGRQIVSKQPIISEIHHITNREIGCSQRLSNAGTDQKNQGWSPTRVNWSKCLAILHQPKSQCIFPERTLTLRRMGQQQWKSEPPELGMCQYRSSYPDAVECWDVHNEKNKFYKIRQQETQFLCSCQGEIQFPWTISLRPCGQFPVSCRKKFGFFLFQYSIFEEGKEEFWSQLYDAFNWLFGWDRKYDELRSEVSVQQIGSLHKSKHRSCCKKLENERRSINTRCKHYFSEDGGHRKKNKNAT